ncbi:hypothetical protein SCHPADRAFT_469881 [Schizopora paradoxa]|uniref:Uncharacterized protein n=1 Tax=Schizopora paradoxa TaxID=27342 RepID=A0A0H2RIL0_9AGAM|nr:hypothetical protein SCHPADRAFT_469881 [Schizopora paradoxa]
MKALHFNQAYALLEVWDSDIVLNIFTWFPWSFLAVSLFVLLCSANSEYLLPFSYNAERSFFSRHSFELHQAAERPLKNIRSSILSDASRATTRAIPVCHQYRASHYTLLLFTNVIRYFARCENIVDTMIFKVTITQLHEKQ